jgi:hypothetical protein
MRLLTAAILALPTVFNGLAMLVAGPVWYGSIPGVIGAVVGLIASVALLIWVPAPLLSLVVVAAAIMGAAYRRFAGLEPLPLPEAVLATDPAALVGEHDPARQTRAVIMNG